MRIGIDSRITRNWDTGVGRYTISLLKAMMKIAPENRYILFTNSGISSPPLKANPCLEVQKISVNPGSPQQYILLPKKYHNYDLDILFSTHPLAAIPITLCPSVAAILDLYPIHFPDQFPRGTRLYFLTIFRWIAQLKRKIIAISLSTKQDVIKYLGVMPEKIAVTYLAPEDSFYPRKKDSRLAEVLVHYGINSEYILYHGNKRPHKNIIGLLRAFAVFKRRCAKPIWLVITGREDPLDRERNFRIIRSEIINLGIQDWVHFTGYISDQDLPYLYSGAICLANPSFYEGFGLPPLEAMACGTPVVVSNAGSLPEVVGNAGLIVTPMDLNGIADAMYELVMNESLQKKLIDLSLLRAKQFSWDLTGLETLNIFYEASKP